jgi:LemA protein
MLADNLLLILILLVFVPIVLLVTLYNKLAKLKIRIDEAWSQIDVQLKRRADLIPNLVSTVKGYAQHEKQVFENVTKARSALMSATTPEEAGKADTMLTGALKSLFAVAEAYPQLRAQENFTNLQDQLSDTEDKVSYARQFYNNSVREFNEKLVVFPSNIIAKMFGFEIAEFFEATEDERENVDVQF